MKTQNNKPGRPTNASRNLETKRPLTIRLTDLERRRAEYIGNGNASAGIRKLLALCTSCT